MTSEELLKAMSLIDDDIKAKEIEHGKKASTAGFVKCPVCGNKLSWSRVIHPKRTGRQRQQLAFKCDTEACISGSGH